MPFPEADGFDPLIAIDGPAASGKGSVAVRLAAVYGLSHLDTGLLYRAVGISASPDSNPASAIAAARALSLEQLTDPRQRPRGAGALARPVAAQPEVR